MRAVAERADESDPDAPLTFVASTPGVKRDGLDLRASGWRIDRALTNPVFQWAHDYRRPPIGRFAPTVDDDALRIAVTFDREDPFAADIERKYRRGFLNAVSVGWDFVDENGERLSWWSLDAEEIRDEAFYDLTEVSAVPVPADPDALIERQRAGLIDLGRGLLDLLDEPPTPAPAGAVTEKRVRELLDEWGEQFSAAVAAGGSSASQVAGTPSPDTATAVQLLRDGLAALPLEKTP